MMLEIMVEKAILHQNDAGKQFCNGMMLKYMIKEVFLHQNDARKYTFALVFSFMSFALFTFYNLIFMF